MVFRVGIVGRCRWKAGTMLKSIPETALSDFDLAVFQAVVPQDHYLRKVMACIDFEAFRPRLISSYDPDFGRPAIDPVRMLKILFLRFHYRLSDRQGMERTVTDGVSLVSDAGRACRNSKPHQRHAFSPAHWRRELVLLRAFGNNEVMRRPLSLLCPLQGRPGTGPAHCTALAPFRNDCGSARLPS